MSTRTVSNICIRDVQRLRILRAEHFNFGLLTRKIATEMPNSAEPVGIEYIGIHVNALETSHRTRIPFHIWRFLFFSSHFLSFRIIYFGEVAHTHMK